MTLATDEILAALVPVERIAAVTYMADDPGISHVVDFFPAPPAVARVRASLEQILDTRPDLVLVAPYIEADVLAALEHADVMVYRYESNDGFENVFRGIERLGSIVGADERAAATVAAARARLAAVAERLAVVRERPRVLFWSRGWTAGPNTNVGEIIERAHGHNVAADLSLSGHPALSEEQMLVADPDVILLPDWSGAEADAGLPAVFQRLVREKGCRLLSIPGRTISAASHFVVDGVELLARELHPEAFAAAASTPGAGG